MPVFKTQPLFSVKSYFPIVFLQGVVFCIDQAILNKLDDHERLSDYGLSEKPFMLVYMYMGGSLTWISIGLFCFICCSFIYKKRNILFNSPPKALIPFVMSVALSILMVYFYIFGFFEKFCRWYISVEILDGMLTSVVFGLCIYHYFVDPETRIKYIDVLKKQFAFSIKPYLTPIFLQSGIFALLQAILSKSSEYRFISDYELFEKILAGILIFVCASMAWVVIGLFCFVCASIIYKKINSYFENSVKTIYPFILSIVLSIIVVLLYIFGFFEWFCELPISSEILLGMLLSVVLGLCVYHYFINPETKIKLS